MPYLPLLPMPPARKGPPPSSAPFGRSNFALDTDRQRQRLGPKFERLERILAGKKAGLFLQRDPSSIAPERALVLEIAESIDNFYNLVRGIDGLEFLAEEETNIVPDDDFFELDTRSGRKGEPRMDRPIRGRIYLSMPDVRALRELVSLWNFWQEGKTLPHGKTRWKHLFSKLHDIRPWSIQDRLTDEIIEIWRNSIEIEPSQMYRIEAELWFHENENCRDLADRRLFESVLIAGGKIVDHVVIEEIGYHAVLIDLPSSEIRRLTDRESIHLAICDDVMFLRPQSTVDISEPSDPSNVKLGDEPILPNDLPPIAALLDGMPVQQHRLLAGRLDVDDANEIETISVLGERRHGTAMASLILHGDRNRNDRPIARRLHVHPILFAPGEQRPEMPKRDGLFIDTIYRAVKRMKEGEADGEPTAPDVFLVNLSLGDPNRPFSGLMSPWARLLDYLAERYRILFLVSAGNISLPLPIEAISSWVAFEDAEPREREKAVLLALTDHKAYRTLISPAEALNIVTVGARHEDAYDGPSSPMSIDPYMTEELPNVSSAMGLGHRKVIKPEIHMPGGRENVQYKTSRSPLSVKPALGGYGLSAASPDPRGRLDQERLVHGTSAATALATRAAHQLFDTLMDTSRGSMHADLDPGFRAVVVKALLIHRSSWGTRAALLEDIYGPHGQGKHVERRDNIARLLGYGFPIIEEALTCAPYRATLLGFGEIEARKTNIHRIPLPPSLENVRVWRAITVTVAWFSPVNLRHATYRRAKLEVRANTKMDATTGATRISEQPSDSSIPRGTVFHTRYEGRQAVSFVDEGHVNLQIYCREQAGQLDQSIRYGIAVTIESGESIRVYEEIRSRLAIPIRSQPTVVGSMD